MNVTEKLRPRIIFDRVVKAFDICSKLAAEPTASTSAGSSSRASRSTSRRRSSTSFDVVHDELGNKNFGVLYDTCHAHMCAAVGANQTGEKETLPGGELELLEKLKGKITHVHLIDSDGSLNEHNTSTHNPFGTGKLNFDKLAPALNQRACPTTGGASICASGPTPGT